MKYRSLPKVEVGICIPWRDGGVVFGETEGDEHGGAMTAIMRTMMRRL